jgi:hypothetical protein
VAQSPWSVMPYILANSSFNQAVALPASAPDVGPFVCAPIAIAWLPYALGALSQLRQPAAWKTSTDLEISTIMGEVDLFIGAIASAAMCDERGSLSVTITPGNASQGAMVTFPLPFSATPVVILSSDRGDVIASASAVTSSSFTATITANVPVVTSITAVVSWIAGPPS